MAITVNITGGNVQLTGNPILINCSGGSAPIGSTKYKILLQVISQDGKLEGAPFPLAKAPDENGNAVFDISAFVDQPVKPVFQYPASGVMKSYPTQAFNIQVAAGESYIDSDGELQESYQGAEAQIIQMLKGGLSPRQINLMNSKSQTFFSQYVQGDKFLTTRPKGEIVHPEQNIKLWFMVDAAKSATLKLTLHYNDGSTSDYTSSSQSLDTDFLYEFNVNPAQRGMNLEPTGKKATHFHVWLDFGGTTSDNRYFYFDQNFCERPAFLFFANSLGGIDDVYFSGYITDKFATNGSLAVIPPQTEDTVYDPTLITVDKKGTNKWSINTGWKHLTTMQFYRDLLLTRKAWYLYSNSTQSTFSIIPILLDTGEQVIFNRQEDLWSIDIPITEAHESAFAFDNRSY